MTSMKPISIHRDLINNSLKPVRTRVYGFTVDNCHQTVWVSSSWVYHPIRTTPSMLCGNRDTRLRLAKAWFVGVDI